MFGHEFFTADDLDAQLLAIVLAIFKTSAVVSEMVVVAHQKHLHVELFLEDGAHELLGTHLCQLWREIHEHDLVNSSLLEEGSFLVGS